MFSLAVITLASLTFAFPVACSFALSRGYKHVEFLQTPLREWPLRAVWAGPIAFGRKFTIVAVVAAARSQVPCRSLLPLRVCTCARLTVARPQDYLQLLPQLIVTTLLIFVLLQVGAALASLTSVRACMHARTYSRLPQMVARPYRREDNNVLETACLLVLLFRYSKSNSTWSGS